MSSEKEPEGRLRDLQAKYDVLASKYESLRKRKVVRVGLAAASVVSRLKRVVGRRTPAPSPVPEPQPAPPSEPLAEERPPAAKVDVPRKHTADLDLVQPGTLDLLAVAPLVTVVVPVFNAYEELSRCVASMQEFVSAPVLYVDDGSTDERVVALLGEEADRPDVSVVTNPENLGFVATVNRALDEVEGDVLVLNSDTRVGPRLVERMRLAAYTDPRIASVTAISDNAGAFSAPAMGSNEIPQGWDPEDAARAVAQTAQHRHPETPTANGFCMYLTRRALDDVGGFDMKKYPRGYGEENDWSMRARALGWHHVVCDSAYVSHTRSASFGDEKTDLSAAGFRTLAKDHPSYERLATEFVKSDEMAEVRRSVGEALTGNRARPRILFVLHAFMGGAPETTKDLMSGIGDRYDPYLMKCDGATITVTDPAGERVVRHRLQDPLEIDTPSSTEYRQVVASLLVDLDIEVVHIRHFLGHTLDLPGVTRALGIPVVLSVHDFYLLCPTAHLIDNQGRFCGGVCTASQGVCPAVPWVAEGPHLKHGWVDVWKDRVAAMAPDVDVMVATTDITRRRHIEVLPTLGELPWEVVEHGRDLTRSPSVATAPDQDGQVRLLMAGTIGEHKGNQLVRSILDEDTSGRLRMHVLGTFPGPDHPRITVHGLYERDEFVRLAAEIRPAALLIASVTAETYSHTLTEAMAAGLPVFVTDRGAPQERIADGGGWVIPADDPAAALGVILEAVDDADAYQSAVGDTTRFTWPSVGDMAERYVGIYDRLRRHQRP